MVPGGFNSDSVRTHESLTRARGNGSFGATAERLTHSTRDLTAENDPL